MKREQLVQLGVAENLIEEIMKLHGLDINKTKEDLQTATTNVETLTNQLKEANNAIEGFKSVDAEGLKKSITDWETKYAQLQKESAENLTKVKYDTDLAAALKEAKARNPKSVRALLDEATLKYDPEKRMFEGLQEQLNILKEKESYQFEGTKETKTLVSGEGKLKTVSGDKMADAIRQGAGLPAQ
jgi:hypothetical protein